MPSSNPSQLTSAITQAKKYIPVVCPLQQFAATNPLWDLIDQPIKQVSKSMHQMQDIQFTQPLRKYWHDYQQGEINEAALRTAIAESSVFDVNQACGDEFTLSDKGSYHQGLYQFLTHKNTQSELIKQLELAQEDKTTRIILFASQVSTYSYDNVLDSIKSECLNWLSRYFNPTGLQKKLLENLSFEDKKTSSNESYSLFDFWREMMREKNKAWRSFLTDKPDDIESFILNLLAKLAVPKHCFEQYVFAVFWQLKGWIGYLKWQQKFPDNPYCQQKADMTEALAIWLANEVFWLLQHQKKSHDFKPNYTLKAQNQLDDIIKEAWLKYHKIDNSSEQNRESLTQKIIPTYPDLVWLWQHAYELNYQEPLLRSLLKQKKILTANNSTQHSEQSNDQQAAIKSQWVLCIDVRSEGLRRHLEETGQHETFGFAGFFGFAHQLNNLDKNQATNQCPALIDPDLLVEIFNTEKPVVRDAIQNFTNSIHHAKKDLLAPFALYEMMGAWYSVTLMLKNHSTHLLQKIKALCKIDDDNICTHSTVKIAYEDSDAIANIAMGLLKGISLTNNFAEFVVVCGHSASTENNPYQAALDCGACGGNSGLSNAMVACQALNNPAIREIIAKQGIVIPASTIFIPACHNTTTDDVLWYEVPNTLNAEQTSRLAKLKEETAQASKSLQQERIKDLPGDPNLKRRSQHWAELTPEWGLANNAGMIIASRKLTQDLNLARRVFLHSYEAELDTNGSILESILLGPMIVAHWINYQYYFSSVDPENYASGNKTLQNVLPQVGVMEGNQSDLKYGLPQQNQNKRPHEPRRLCVFVDADRNTLEQLIERHPVLSSLIKGQWIWIYNISESLEAT